MQVDRVCYTVVSDTTLNYLCNHAKFSCIPFGCKGFHFFYLGSPTNSFFITRSVRIPSMLSFLIRHFYCIIFSYICIYVSFNHVWTTVQTLIYTSRQRIKANISSMRKVKHFWGQTSTCYCYCFYRPMQSKGS